MRKVKLLIWIIVVCVISMLWFYSCNYLSQKKSIEKKNYKLPDINILTTIDKKIILSEFSNDEIKVIIYFNTHCDFCQFELEELSKRSSEFENTEVILVSAEPIDSLILFEKSFGLHAYPNIGVYHCPYDSLLKYFGQLAAPTTFIYGADNKLLKRFNGSTRIDDMLEVIKLAACNDDTKENITTTND